MPLASATTKGLRWRYWSAAWLAANVPALNAATFQTTLPLGEDVQVCLRLNTAPACFAPNNPPVFPAPDPRALSIPENSPLGTNIGAPVTATDADGDPLTYSLTTSPYSGYFQINSATGQLRTNVADGSVFNHEYPVNVYGIQVVADDGRGGTAQIDVAVSVTDVDEPPRAPGTVTGSGTTSLEVTWTAPSNVGRPDIEDYDVQYREEGASQWTDGPQDVDVTRATIMPVDAGKSYEVQVRATNHEGDGPWAVWSATPPPPPPPPTYNLLIGTHLAGAGDKTITSSTIYAQEFSTGSNENGYTLKRMWLSRPGNTDPNRYDISIWGADSSGNPDSLKQVFAWVSGRNISGGASGGYVSFTAPDGPANYLHPNTTYFIVAKTTGPNIKLETAHAGEIIRERGWSIATEHRVSSNGGSTWSSESKLIAFKIWGIANRSPARLGAVTVTAPGPVNLTKTGRPYKGEMTIYKGEIPAGTDMVTIDARPGETTSTLEYLFPDGSTVPDADTQSGLQVSPITDLTEVDLKITSADNIWNRTFRVHLRRAANTTVQAPATGTVKVTGDLVVGGTLSASASNVTDPNGTYFAETGRSGYDLLAGRRQGFHFVWYADHPRYDATRNSYIILGQGPRLVLTQNMRGRRSTHSPTTWPTTRPCTALRQERFRLSSRSALRCLRSLPICPPSMAGRRSRGSPAGRSPRPPSSPSRCASARRSRSAT